MRRDYVELDFPVSETFRAYELELNYGDAYANREMPIEKELPQKNNSFYLDKNNIKGEEGIGEGGGGLLRGDFIKRGEFIYLLNKLNEHIDTSKKRKKRTYKYE